MTTAFRVIAGAALMAPLATASLSAELTRVDLKARGMDCATCAHAARVRLQQVEGVESVRISLETGVAEILLTPGNATSLDRLAATTRENGFHPVSAIVTARGDASLSEGSISLRLPESATVFVVGAPADRGALLDALKAELATAALRIEVTGEVAFKDRRASALMLRSFARMPR